MNVQLKAVTRENWEEALSLKVKAAQSRFVPEPAVSLAKVYIKPDGDNVQYIPFAIYNQKQMVGFIMHAYIENTANMYWINGFMIDEKHQGKGYGKAALDGMISWIIKTFPACKEIRLTVHRENHTAMGLYEKYGFVPLGEAIGEEDVWSLPVSKL
ncbi:GNAT family N-acetyltransferase [Bacillus sp. MUM 13]|uniref:GNAT family N-acetyltransferase n=1 Tax=Bacillus sp. MUM 13 TaxID=1678001 RepID=UPI0008F5995F|nr:GNAT family N-acetyltransferase [Bacillus sp. MUM 13]OIK13749.1 GNAT family N-acetyltransferase [Bacillus sp. MUM 13]